MHEALSAITTRINSVLQQTPVILARQRLTVGGSEVQGHCWLYTEFKASLGYRHPISGEWGGKGWIENSNKVETRDTPGETTQKS